MRYAEVSVNSPAARRRTFSYRIPENLIVAPGQAVWVPFGDKELQGIVMELVDTPAVSETKEIAGVIEPGPRLSPARIALARWLSDYYLAPLFDAVALMLPPGFERGVVTYLSLLPSQDKPRSSLAPETVLALELIRKTGRANLKEIETALGKRRARDAAVELTRKGLAVKSYELTKTRVKPKLASFLSLAASAGELETAIARLTARRAAKQIALLAFLREQSGPVAWSEVKRRLNIDRAAARALAGRGLIQIQERTVKRDPLAYLTASPSPPLTLTAAQKAALSAIKSSLASHKSEVFLLHGVTGSGKTEVYLQALAEAVRLGKRGIVLVPEIALTPQTIERFAARFPQRVAVLHSRLAIGEQFDEWQRISEGEASVVIGPRSAVFAPQPDLGLIVVDEEHEWSYKQDSASPRYHARTVALKLAGLCGATVILGSATPDVESYYRSQRGEYQRLALPERVTPKEGAPLPEVEIADLREELKAGNRSIFSRPLSEAVSGATGRGEQVILFLNRRGGAGFVQCRNCGYVLRCRRCEVALTHHPDRDAMVCHQCSSSAPVPDICPQCQSRRIKFLGLGTQKLAEATARSFPDARLLRWDSDTARGKDAHRLMLESFRSHQADILIGTQMIAKGLDLPLVTVVGVINADLALNLPDFRAGERTFQLISQVLGRAGRGDGGGRVVIQTYLPEHYAIQAAAQHDYRLFFDKEIEYREKLRQPPFSRLARLVFSHPNEAVAQREAERLKERLSQEIAARGASDLDIIGPAPAFIHRLRGRFRWQLILRGRAPEVFLSRLPLNPGWVVDIDPVGLA